MAISQNCDFDNGGRRSRKFPKFSKTIKIVDTSLYLTKKSNFIEFRLGTPKKSHFEVGDFLKFSDFQGFPQNFRPAKISESSKICLKIENFQNFQKFWSNCSHTRCGSIAIKNEILLRYNKLHSGKFSFF